MKNINFEVAGDARLKSYGRNYNTSNVSDFVSILISNGYVVTISRPSEDEYYIQYGYGEEKW